MPKNFKTATLFAMAVALHFNTPTDATLAALNDQARGLLPNENAEADLSKLGVNLVLPDGAENIPVPANFGETVAALFGPATTKVQAAKPALATARTPLNAEAVNIGMQRAAAAAVAAHDDENDDEGGDPEDEEDGDAAAAVAVRDDESEESGEEESATTEDEESAEIDSWEVISSLGLTEFVPTLSGEELSAHVLSLTSDEGFHSIAVIINRILTFPEVALVSPCLAYALAQMNNQTFEFPEETAQPQTVSFRDGYTILVYPYDSTGAVRTDLNAAWTKAFNEAPQYIEFGTPIRQSDKAGPGTEGTRKWQGIGGEPSIVIAVS